VPGKLLEKGTSGKKSQEALEKGKKAI